MSDMQKKHQRQRLKLMIDKLPDEALEEVEREFEDILEFWKTREQYQPPPIVHKTIKYRLIPIE